MGFFLRYADGGYHVRLRLQGERSTLQQRVRPFLDNAISRFFLQEQDALRLTLPETSTAALRAGEWVRDANYEPEYAKYGGHHGIPVSEAHFGVSSDVAIEVISAEKQQLLRRTTAAIDLINLLLHAFTPHRAEHAFILKAYTGYWLTQIYGKNADAVYKKMESSFQRQRPVLRKRLYSETNTLHSPQLQPLFDGWRTHCNSTVQALVELEQNGVLPDRIGARSPHGQQLLHGVPTITRTPNVALLLLPNYLHMLNNRLGITPLKEAQLTHLMYRTIESEHGIAVNDYPMRLEPS